MARLVVEKGPVSGHAFDLKQGVSTIGRAPENDIVVQGDGISRRHAEVRAAGGRFEIADLESKNGLLVNGERLVGVRVLATGDVLVLPGWTLRFEGDDVTMTRPIAMTGAPAPVSAGAQFALNREKAEVIVRGKVVELAPKEYLALLLLHERAGSVVTKEDLATHVWPEYNGDVSDYNIHQVISRLRRELEENPVAPRLIITRPGFGYRLDLPR